MEKVHRYGMPLNEISALRVMLNGTSLSTHQRGFLPWNSCLPVWLFSL